MAETAVPAVRTTNVTNPILRFRANPTRKNAIHAMCCHCHGVTDDSLEPGFRASIRTCSIPTCPLFPFRPYQRSDADDEAGETA
jgi:hypothetical protein